MECGGYVWSGADDCKLCVWNPNTFECIKLLDAHKAKITCMSVVGNTLWTGSWDTSIKIWDPTTLDLVKEVKVYQHTDAISAILHFNHDGSQYIWTASWDKCIVVWKGNSVPIENNPTPTIQNSPAIMLPPNTLPPPQEAPTKLPPPQETSTKFPKLSLKQVVRVIGTAPAPKDLPPPREITPKDLPPPREIIPKDPSSPLPKEFPNLPVFIPKDNSTDAPLLPPPRATGKPPLKLPKPKNFIHQPSTDAFPKGKLPPILGKPGFLRANSYAESEPPNSAS